MTGGGMKGIKKMSDKVKDWLAVFGSIITAYIVIAVIIGVTL